MSPLLAALAAPVAGPVLYRLLHERPGIVRVVDGFVYVAVPALVAWQILPSAWSQRRLSVIGAVALGLLIPWAMERASRALARHTDDMALVVGLSGLVLHAALEGAALAPGTVEAGGALALAVTLHRVPIGFVIWWLIRPRHGVLLASTAVGSVVVATLVGAVLGAELLAAGAGSTGELYQALVSGSLIHVVFHQGRHDHTHDRGDHGEGAHG